MLIRPAVPGFVAAALLASALVSGCSGGSGEATDTKSPPPSAKEQAYYRCLESNGVTLEKRDDGQLRVDKDKYDAAVEAKAQTKCVDLLPGQESAAPAPAEVVVKAMKFSACVRENGFSDYPDPDPKTAKVELTADQQPKYATPAFQAAAQKCSSGSSGGVVGG
uniref:Lipoprotein n=1 Tax=Streptomyces sp. NBC_00049 TaxID=2903617 RepID=A0AAU2JU96_9ACTN